MSEKKKFKYSHHSGAGDNERYKPSLWYYEQMNFLNDHLTSRPSKSNSEDLISQYVVHDTGELVLEEEAADETQMTNELQSQVEEREESQLLEVVNASPGRDELITEIKTPVNNSLKIPSARGKNVCKRKHDVDTDDWQKCCNAIESAASTISSISAAGRQSTTTDESEDTLYGKYIGKVFSGIKNERIKLHLKQAIDAAIYTAKLSGLDK